MTHEVVIVGGGLTGSVLSVALAQRGIRSLVLERTATTPELLRGELIMPRGVAVLDALGLGARLRDVCVETEGTVLHHPTFGEVQVDYSLAPPPLEVSAETWRPRGLCGWRRPLYEELRRAARATDGVEFRDGFEVQKIERHAQGLVLEGKGGEKIAARLVVAADGANSLLRRLMGFEPVEAVQRTFVQGFVGRAPSYSRRHVHVGAHAVGAAFVFPFPDGHFRSTIEYGESLRGELALPSVHPERRVAPDGRDPESKGNSAKERPFDSDSRASRASPRSGRTESSSQGERSGARAKDLLARHLEVLKEALPEIWEELGGPKIEALTDLHVQPGQSVQMAGIVEDGFVLIGDAAGSLDPFTGFGMALGLTDAELLAQVLHEAGGDYSARNLRRFERRRHAGIAARREATDILAYAFLDRSEGFADPLAARLGERWSDREWILPLVAAQFAGYDAVVEPSVGMKYHFLGLL